jgi:hypothetical protein
LTVVPGEGQERIKLVGAGGVVQVGGLVAPLAQVLTHEEPFHTSGAVQVLQVGGLLAPFPQSGKLTTTFVQAPQLLPSFDSVIVLTQLALLSAQARTYIVPAVVKVIDFEVLALPPAARADIPATE